MLPILNQTKMLPAIWYILCISDLHYGYYLDTATKINYSKNLNYNAIKNFSETHNVEISLVAGDITDHSSDGHQFGKLSDEHYDEFQSFLDDYYAKLEAINISVYFTIGNHDILRKNYPNLGILKYVRDKFGATYSWLDYRKSGKYTFEYRGILFMSLGLYPNDPNWLRSHLPPNKSKPIILFFHYNFIEGENYSRWWSYGEKNEFYDIIKSYNILFIHVGHHHVSSLKQWMGINVVNGSGSHSYFMQMNETKYTKYFLVEN